MTQPDNNLESLVPCIAELERAVDWAYSLVGGRPSDSLPVVITVQTRGQRKSCLGAFITNKWETREGQSVHEILIAAETLHMDPMEIIGTVIHETAHLYCRDHYIKDCANSGRHNKRYQEAAWMFGLECVSIGDSRGYSYTSFDSQMAKRIEEDFEPDYLAFQLARNASRSEIKEPTMSKWSCGCTIVRASRGVVVNAPCRSCGNDFMKEAK